MPQNGFQALIQFLVGGTPTNVSASNPLPVTLESEVSSMAVTVADGADVAQGHIGDAAWSGSGNGTVVSVLKAVYAKVAATLTTKSAGLKYYEVPASTTQALGTGAVGDTLNALTIIPLAAAAGIVQIKDGAGAAFTVFDGGGTTALTDLKPFTIPLNALSAAGGWSVITNANVTAIAVGQFTP